MRAHGFPISIPGQQHLKTVSGPKASADWTSPRGHGCRDAVEGRVHPGRPWLPVAPTARVCNHVTLAICSGGPPPLPKLGSVFQTLSDFQLHLSSRIPGCFRICSPPTHLVHPALCFLRVGDSHLLTRRRCFAQRKTEVGNDGGCFRNEREKRDTRFQTVSVPMFKWVVSLSLFF